MLGLLRTSPDLIIQTILVHIPAAQVQKVLEDTALTEDM